MPALSEIVKKSLSVLITVNGAVLALSGMFLIDAGAWRTLWPGVTGIILSATFVFSILLIPAAFFGGMVGLSPGNKKMERVFMCLSFGYICALWAGYMTLSFFIVADLAHDETLLPALGWGISSAVMPWALMMTRDRDNTVMIGLCWMFFAGGIVVAGVAYAGKISLFMAFMLCFAVMAAGLSVQALVEKIVFSRKQKTA